MPNTSDLKVHLDQRYVAEELFDLQRAIRTLRAQFCGARSVYRENDRRAAINNQISHLLGSMLIEVKQHAVGD